MVAISCGGGGGGGPGGGADAGGTPGNDAGSGEYVGTETCNGTMATTSGTLQTLPSQTVNTSASGARNGSVITLTHLSIGPYAGFSCVDQTLTSSGSTPLPGDASTFVVGNAACSNVAAEPAGEGTPSISIPVGTLTPTAMVLQLILATPNNSNPTYVLTCTYNLHR